MTQFQTLLIEDRGPVRLVTLNQPEMYNPLDQTSGQELIQALEEAEREQSVRALVLTGAGKAFSAGGNVRLMGKLVEQGGARSPFFSEIAALLNRTIITLRHLPKPVVCALNGVAAGGGLGWCLACDLVVAAQGARLDPGYIRIAVNPDGGNSLLVTHLIGHKRASAFFMLARPISAQEALAWGMVNQVVPDHQVLASALELAQELARGPAQALASTKRLINRAVFGDLESILEQERREIMRLVDEPDHAEGIRAFFEKRPPRFA